MKHINQDETRGRTLMDLICLRIAKKICGDASFDDAGSQAKCGVFEGWLSVVGNLALFLFKLIAGLMLGSTALIADAVHTASDCVTSGVVIIAFYFSGKPGDKEHPFGHGRMDLIGALIISVLLFVASVDLFKSSVAGILDPVRFQAGFVIIALLLLSVVAKEALARFSLSMGRLVKSKALQADAMHHRTDAVTTILVVLALIASRLGFARADGLAGAVISVFVAWTAYSLMKGAVSPLLGEAPSEKTVEAINSLARRRKGVLGVHGIQVHKYGRKKIISFHVEVSDEHTCAALHEMADHLEHDVGKTLNASVLVHVDPLNINHPIYETASAAVARAVAENQRLHSFHDLRVEDSRSGKRRVMFDVILNEALCDREIKRVVADIKARLKPELPDTAIAVKAEQPYIS